jgi:TRAP-type C4-dicarboxylate transport system substrate-binding protein
MKNPKTKILMVLAAITMLAVLSSHLYSLTIKIGSVAPERSPWDKALREMAREWTKITEGMVKLKIYPGSIAGSEDDMIRKMRMGILGGAVLTNRGFTNLYPDAYVLNIPFLIITKDELDYVMEKMTPVIEKEVEKKGYKVVIFCMAGWLHFFSKQPLLYPEDMKKHKLAYTTGEPRMEQAWKKSGYHIVPIEIRDMMMGLQSGMVDAFYLPPLLAGSGQYFPLAPHMCAQRIAPLVGGIVIPKRTWKKIPDKYKDDMMKVALRISIELYEKTVKLEKETIETMKEHGLKIVDIPTGAMEKWRAAAAKGMDELIGKAFSKDIYNQVRGHLENFRKSRTLKQ